MLGVKLLKAQEGACIVFHIQSEWKNKVSIDIRALGSEVFFLLVFIRASIGPYFPFVWQILIAGISLTVIFYFFKEFDGYLARGLVIGVFVSNYYDSTLFYGFTVILAIAMIIALRHQKTSWLNIRNGSIVGIICIALGFIGGDLLMQL